MKKRAGSDPGRDLVRCRSLRSVLLPPACVQPFNRSVEASDRGRRSQSARPMHHAIPSPDHRMSGNAAVRSVLFLLDHVDRLGIKLQELFSVRTLGFVHFPPAVLELDALPAHQVERPKNPLDMRPLGVGGLAA